MPIGLNMIFIDETIVHFSKVSVLFPIDTRSSHQGETLQWRHNECDGLSNHQLHDCLLNRLFRRRSKKTSKLRVTGVCEGNSSVNGKIPAHKRASNAEKASILWRPHVNRWCGVGWGWGGWWWWWWWWWVFVLSFVRSLVGCLNSFTSAAVISISHDILDNVSCEQWPWYQGYALETLHAEMICRKKSRSILYRISTLIWQYDSGKSHSQRSNQTLHDHSLVCSWLLLSRRSAQEVY